MNARTLLLPLALIAACDYVPPAGTTASTFVDGVIEYSDGTEDEVCEFEFFAMLDSEVFSACVVGSTDPANPEIPEITFLSPD